MRRRTGQYDDDTRKGDMELQQKITAPFPITLSLLEDRFSCCRCFYFQYRVSENTARCVYRLTDVVRRTVTMSLPLFVSASSSTHGLCVECLKYNDSGKTYIVH